MEGGTLPLELPLRGTIERVNPRLAERPHLVSHSPTDEGWLFDVKLDDPVEFDLLLSEHEVLEYYGNDGETFRRLACAALEDQGPHAGSKLQDGGRLMDDLARLVGPLKYLNIVKKRFMGYGS